MSVPEALAANGTRFTALERAAAGDGEPAARRFPPIRANNVYRCGGEGCGVPVVYVPGHAHGPGRGPGAGGWQRRPYIKLQKRENGDHTADCPYSFDAATGRIIDLYAQEVETDGDRFVLVLRATRETNPTITGAVPEPATDRITVNAPTGDENPRLIRTIQAAATVAELINRFADEPDRIRRFSATWRGRRIAWADFCFDLTTTTGAQRLHTALRRRAEAGTADRHPIAVHGWVEFPVRPSFAGDTGDLRISGLDEPHVRVRGSLDQLAQYEVGDTLVIYGDWTYWAQGREAQMWLDRNGGIAKLAT